jgi:hypothetical protein
VLGLGLASIWAVVTSGRLALDRRESNTNGAAVFGMWCAGLAAFLLAPAEISVLGSWVVLLAGLSFGAGIRPLVPAQQPRTSHSLNAETPYQGPYQAAPLPSRPSPATRNRLS